ncbi:MAG: pilus assembly protein [Gemmataceae bacterium]|nr:pilus assembly protein [Gemmataceae bacterium]
MRPRWRRTGIRGNAGQATVEFGLVVIILCLGFFGILEFSRYFYTRLSLRHLVREAARFAVTGNALPDSLGSPLPRGESIQQVILSSDRGYGLRLDPSNIALTPSDGGGPGDLVQVGVTYQYRVVAPLLSAAFPNGTILIRVTTVMKNEAF